MSAHRSTAVLSVLIGLLLAATVAGASEPVFPPGSRIGLVPPQTMRPARGLAGFRDESTGAGIVMLEMPPDAYPALAASFSDEALAAQGFALVRRGKVPLPSGEAMTITGEQTTDGQRSVKSMLLAPEPSMTVLVMGQLPAGSPPERIADVEQALRTVAIRAPLSLDEKIEALPFAIGDRAGFRPVRTMAGNAVMLTDGPSDAIRDADQPMIIVAQAFAAPPPASQRDTFARQGLVSNGFIRDLVLERSQGYRQGGAEWHELVAKAKDTQSGTPVIVMQTIRFDSDGYIRSVGIVRPDARDAVLPRFRRIVDSLAEK